MFYLCHKCSGVLGQTEKDHGLYGCQCISGYLRGFEKALTIEEACIAQIQQELSWMSLYVSQNRTENRDPTRLNKAIAAAQKCGVFPHGNINWALLGKPVATTE